MRKHAVLGERRESDATIDVGATESITSPDLTVG